MSASILLNTNITSSAPRPTGLILLALLVLTATTTGAAFINMGVFSPIVALGIACLKAVLVILFFMHIRYSSRVMMLTVGAGFFTFLVLITMTLSDYISRNWGLVVTDVYRLRRTNCWSAPYLARFPARCADTNCAKPATFSASSQQAKD